MAGGSSLPVSVQTSTPVSGTGNRYFLPRVVLTSLFFMWGFITCLNDIIIPHLKGIFELNYAQAMLVQFAFFTAYFIVSLPSGAIVTKLGYKNGIIIGLCTAGPGRPMFYPPPRPRAPTPLPFSPSPPPPGAPPRAPRENPQGPPPAPPTHNRPPPP